ncbi:SMP-30/gluconolactonase/LRE family protein, partial [Acinetobacter baumannii]
MGGRRRHRRRGRLSARGPNQGAAEGQPLIADVRVVPRDRRDRLGEGLLWSAREQAVYWVDILGQHVHRLDLVNDMIAS